MGTAAGLSVLIIGASHLATPGYLITTLHDELLKLGANVHTMGICGSRPSHWVKPIALTCGAAERKGNNPATYHVGTQGAKSLEQLVAESKPSWVVVVMGDTIGGYRTSLDVKWASNEVSDLTREIQRLNIKCAWVGPAWGREGGRFSKTDVATQAISNFLSTNTSPCKYIDSLKMSKPGEWQTIDGQHFTSTGYKYWGQNIAKELSGLW
jgi:hypothetical protein